MSDEKKDYLKKWGKHHLDESMQGDKPLYTISDRYTTSTTYKRPDGTQYMLLTDKQSGRVKRVEVGQ